MKYEEFEARAKSAFDDCSAKVESCNGLEDAVAGWIQTLVGLSHQLRSYCEITAKLLRKVVDE